MDDEYVVIADGEGNCYLTKVQDGVLYYNVMYQGSKHDCTEVLVELSSDDNDLVGEE